MGDTSGPPPFIPFEKTKATKPTKTQPTKSSTDKNTSGQKPLKAGESSTAHGNTSIKSEKEERKLTKDAVEGRVHESKVLQKGESSKQTDQPRRGKREEKTRSDTTEHLRVKEKTDKGGAAIAAPYDKRLEPQKKQKPAVDHHQDAISASQPSSQEKYNRSVYHQSDKKGERFKNMEGRKRYPNTKQGQRTGRTVDLSEWIGTRIAEPAMAHREEPIREENRYQHDQYYQSDRHQRDQHDRHQHDQHQHDRHQSDRHQCIQHQPQHFPTISEPLVLEQYNWDKMVNSKSTVPFSAKPYAK